MRRNPADGAPAAGRKVPMADIEELGTGTEEPGTGPEVVVGSGLGQAKVA
jgi:hypothetical protein